MGNQRYTFNLYLWGNEQFIYFSFPSVGNDISLSASVYSLYCLKWRAITDLGDATHFFFLRIIDLNYQSLIKLHCFKPITVKLDIRISSHIAICIYLICVGNSLRKVIFLIFIQKLVPIGMVIFPMIQSTFNITSDKHVPSPQRRGGSGGGHKFLWWQLGLENAS